MNRWLKKGSSTVCFQYETVDDSIRAEKFQISASNGAGVLRFDLNPCDSNQKEDESHIHELVLQAFTLDEDYIIQNLKQFLSVHNVNSFEAEILSKSRLLRYKVDIGTAQMGGLAFNVTEQVS
jgi:hypothetical protein